MALWLNFRCIFVEKKFSPRFSERHERLRDTNSNRPRSQTANASKTHTGRNSKSCMSGKFCSFSVCTEASVGQNLCDSDAADGHCDCKC